MKEEGEPVMDWKEIGFTVNEIFRYGYPGLLSFLVATLISPDGTKNIVDALGGGVFSSFIAFGLGGAIYIFYRPFICDRVLFRVCHRIHRWRKPKWGHQKTNSEDIRCNCVFHLLEEKFGVSRSNRLNAYRVVRDEKFNAKFRRNIYLQHSEIHLLYLTAFILWVALMYLILAPLFSPCLNWERVELIVLFPIISVLCLWFGFQADIDLCRRECAYLLKIIAKGEDVGGLLEQAGLGKRPEETKETRE